VAEIIYAGPLTRVTSTDAQGVAITATVLTAASSLPAGLAHGSPVVLSFPDSAVHHLNS
jgi:putative spermidine/putrescine transport system ATP-binding protein